jgi:hypothetical protein
MINAAGLRFLDRSSEASRRLAERHEWPIIFGVHETPNSSHFIYCSVRVFLPFHEEEKPLQHLSDLERNSHHQ